MPRPIRRGAAWKCGSPPKTNKRAAFFFTFFAPGAIYKHANIQDRAMYETGM